MSPSILIGGANHDPLNHISRIGYVGANDMNNAEHILTWIENSAPHYKRLLCLKPGNFIRESGRACAAHNLAVTAYNEMVKCGDTNRDYTAKDICEAAALLCDWRIK